MPNDSRAMLLLALLAFLAISALLVLFAIWQTERRRLQGRIEQLLQEHEKGLLAARRESVEKSRSSLKGQIAEQMAPLLPGFRYLAADARFLGDPIDYVIFNGYTGIRDNQPDGGPLEIVLLEVKQGRSALSPFQRAIARCVEQGKVRFEILRIADTGTAATEAWKPRKGADPE